MNRRVNEHSIALAREWGVDQGSCSESCQRWISACLLARTNYWGRPVSISLRGPPLSPRI